MHLFLSLLFVTCLTYHVAYCYCPSGFVVFDNACYMFPTDHEGSFVEAENYCRQHNSHLLEIHTVSELLFIKDHMRKINSGLRWIGLTDEVAEGVWRWYHSGTYAYVTDWAPGEPNTANGIQEDCVEIDPGKNYQFNDEPCTVRLNPICKVMQ